jgi:hypothetical protein
MPLKCFTPFPCPGLALLCSETNAETFLTRQVLSNVLSVKLRDKLKTSENVYISEEHVILCCLRCFDAVAGTRTGTN